MITTIESFIYVVIGSNPEIPSTLEELKKLPQRKCTIKTTIPDRLNLSVFLIHGHKCDDHKYVLNYVSGKLITYDMLNNSNGEIKIILHP